MCMNAPHHHAVTHDDLERVTNGRYPAGQPYSQGSTACSAYSTIIYLRHTPTRFRSGAPSAHRCCTGPYGGMHANSTAPPAANEGHDQGEVRAARGVSPADPATSRPTPRPMIGSCELWPNSTPMAWVSCMPSLEWVSRRVVYRLRGRVLTANYYVLRYYAERSKGGAACLGYRSSAGSLSQRCSS